MYIDNDINQKNVLDFVRKFKEIGQLEQIAIHQDGKLKLRFAVEPYECSESKQLFSISKSFTSVAIGLAISEKKLDLHDKIVDLFSEYLPDNVHPNLSKMEVYHLLTMTTGHANCFMPIIALSDSPIETFLALDVPYEPGTHFVYNTGATYILSCIINKVTGMDLEQYLKPLFKALNIEDYHFDKYDGVSLGGTGLHVNIDALSNFGLMLLNNGEFNGMQVVPSEYVKMATTKQVDNDNGSTIDWIQGYCFQIWRSQEGFRCDGAYGQLILVLPNRNMVVTVQSYVFNMQTEMDLVMELVNNLYGDETIDDLSGAINEVYKIENSNVFDKDLELVLEENNLEINKIILYSEDEQLKVCFSGKYPFELLVGNGIYIKNTFSSMRVKAKLSDIMPAFYEESVVSCHYVYNDNLKIIMKNHNTPLIQDIVFDFENGVVNINNHCIKFSVK